MLPGGALFNCASQVLAPLESIRHLYTLRDAPPPCEAQEGESCRILHLNDPHWALCVLISCSSLQFGAAFAVTLFPLFGALAISVSRLAIASMVVGSAVWLAARWRTRRGGKMPPGALSWSKEQ